VIAVSRELRAQPAKVVSVNAGEVRTVEWAGRSVTTGIFKSPVNGRRRLEGVNLVGDDQADRRVHGGPDKAIYAYAEEDYRWWSEQLGRELGPGTFGENLTTAGLDLSAAVIGERWAVGTALLEVSEPREPCFKLGIRMGDAAFVQRFGEAGRTGSYLRIVEEGEIGAGDAIGVVARPDHGLTIAGIHEAYEDGTIEALEHVASVDAVSESWREWARRQLARSDD
jgi:MOSC domain-containing protein YiiM